MPARALHFKGRLRLSKLDLEGVGIMVESRKREPWNPILKSYPFSEKVNSVSIGAETLFTRLVAQADDYGNYYGNPKMIVATLYPHRWAKGDVDVTTAGRWRDELVTCTGGALISMYSVNGSEYIHLINPRRRIRGDVSPDERFPREPSNADKQAITEDVPNAARTRTEDVPNVARTRPPRLDPDQDPDQNPDQEKEMQREETALPASKKRSLKGLSRNEVITIYRNSPEDPPQDLSRPQVLAAILDHTEGFAAIVEANKWPKVMMRLGQLFNGRRKVELKYEDLIAAAIDLGSVPKPQGKPASLDYLIAVLTGEASERMVERYEAQAQGFKQSGEAVLTKLADKMRTPELHRIPMRGDS